MVILVIDLFEIQSRTTFAVVVVIIAMPQPKKVSSLSIPSDNKDL